jgi:hypothetical protein
LLIRLFDAAIGRGDLDPRAQTLSNIKQFLRQAGIAAKDDMFHSVIQGGMGEIGAVAAINGNGGIQFREFRAQDLHHFHKKKNAVLEDGVRRGRKLDRFAPRPRRSQCGAGFGEVMDGDSSQPSLPISTATSPMRLEKPHSLSYQVRMRTNTPSIT